MSNLQALCYSCNAIKRDRDDTDFRAIKDTYAHRVADCLFCMMEETRIIGQNELAYSIRDGFPVTPLHTLIIPKRHVGSYFELGQRGDQCLHFDTRGSTGANRWGGFTVADFNIGVNDGAAAGQTIPHCHIHLIPRRKDDVADPRGGVSIRFRVRAYTNLSQPEFAAPQGSLVFSLPLQALQILPLPLDFSLVRLYLLLLLLVNIFLTLELVAD